MMMRIKLCTYILSSILVCLFFSCTDDIGEKDWSTSDEANIYITITTPSTSLPTQKQSQLRSVDEFLIKQIQVLVFEKINGEYLYKYQTDGKYVTSISTDKYKFDALLSKTDNPIKIYLVANASSHIPYLEVNSTEAEVKKSINLSYSAGGLDIMVPMTGEIELSEGITEEKNVTGKMLRSIARVDVINNAENFVLTSVQLYRANNYLQVMPDEKIPETGGISSPSIPSQAQSNVNTFPVLVEGKNYSQQEIYLPESAKPTPENRLLGATCVVIGGEFGDKGETTYYRMDFIPDNSSELWGQVLRNHKYIFNIKSVSGSGWRTPDEAAENLPSNVEVQIKEWNEDNVYMEFDGVSYFGVSSRTANIAAPQNSLDTIQIDTNLTTYQLYWTDANGNIDTSIAPITLGESFTDPDSVFTVSISTDGSQIVFESNTVNDTGTEIVRYLRAEAGRLRIDFTVVQATLRLQMRPLNILGSRNDIGNLGDQLFGGSATGGDRTRYGLIPLLNNLNNFGPTGTVPIESVVRGAQSTAANIPTAWANLFDVLYLTYANNPDNTNSDFIINWVDASSERVIIIQYDNLTTNNNLLTKLGIPQSQRTSGNHPNPFRIHPDAPNEIMNGVFGAVDRTMGFRCFDGIAGAINIDTALSLGISPILITDAGNMALGVDLTRRIVYSGDIDLYNTGSGGRSGEYLTGNGTIANNADRLIANLFAWIATVALTD